MRLAPLPASLTRWALPALAGVTALGVVAAGSSAVAGPAADRSGSSSPAAGAPGFDLSEKLRGKVGPEAIGEHLDAFAAVAAAHDGNRASGTPGYDASVDYVVDTLTAAGYTPEVQAFDFPFYVENSPASFAQVSPTATTYTSPEDFSTMTYSGSGDVTAAVVPVDTTFTPGGANTSGCEAADFAGFPAGSIALVQRGSCPFGQKAANAEDAGAAGVVIFNSGAAGATDSFAGTLGAPDSTIPVVGTSFALGQDLGDPAGTTVRLVTDTTSEIRETYNVTAQTRGGDASEVVMAGAHLDSVVEGAGINDNGSGSAALLETAVQLAKYDEKGNGRGAGGSRLTNAVRFAWWGAEELGLLGSEHYVAELSPEQVEEIALYLNFDMVGSPNYVRFVYDGDNSTGTGAVGPDGSADIERTFVEYFSSQGLASDPSPFNGRSDYGPFIAEGVGIPAGGLFTGAEGVKTPEQAAVYGGEAGVAYDPCYHQECDDRDNVDPQALDEMSDALAHAVATYAVSTASLSGDQVAASGARDARGAKAARLAAKRPDEHGHVDHGAAGNAPDHAHDHAHDGARR